MKKALSISLVITFLLTGCITSKGRFTKNADVAINENYQPLTKVDAEAFAPKIWILFIPLGGSSDQGLYNRAYKKAMKQADGSDGVTSQIVEYKKIKIPLLLITYVNKHISVSGTAYKIKTDSIK